MENITNEMINNEVTENVIEEAVNVASTSNNGWFVLAGVVATGLAIAGGTALYNFCKGKKKTYAKVEEDDVTEAGEELAEDKEN